MENYGGSNVAALGVVPESAVKETLANLEVLAQMKPLMRAKAMFLLTTTLFARKLRCTQSEMEWLKDKFQRSMDPRKVIKKYRKNTSNGDMRKALNIFQSTSTEEEVYGNPLPMDIEQISSYENMKTRKGLAIVDIVREVTMFVFKIEMPSHVRVQLMNDLADIKYRLSFGCNEKPPLRAIVSTFTHARSALVAATKGSSLPIELVEEILARVPIESLIRFKSICKEWYNLFNDDKRFIQKQLDLSREQPRFIRIYQDMVQIINPVTLDLLRLPVPAEFLSAHNYNTLLNIVHCDGLLLCRCGNNRDVDKLVVWNPVLSQVKCIEPLHSYGPFDLFGFGYDNGSYKILRFAYCTGTDYEIYDCKSKLWRGVGHKQSD